MAVRMRITRWQPQPFLNALDREMAARMETAAGLVETAVKASMVGGGRPHVPSRPGEPPHVDTGNLRRNISHSVVVRDRKIRGFVIANTNYARHLEFGTSLMAPRPFLRPALARMQPQIVRILLGRTGPGYLTVADIREFTSRGGSTGVQG